jgi:hypothetical protein
VRDALQRRGYFEAAVYDPKFTAVGRTPNAELVDVAAYVEPGRIYRLGAIDFEHSGAFPTSELRREFPLRDGDILDVEKVRQGLRRLRHLYCARGYLSLTAVPQTVPDESNATIRLAIFLDEGPIFHAGQLLLEGESQPGVRQRLLDAWKPFEGNVFDCNNEVLHHYLREVHARPGVKPDDVFTTTLDQQRHLVNVRLRLARK